MESSEGTGEAIPASRGRLVRVLLVGLWVLAVLEALGMGAAGAAKFASDRWVQMFEGWGYPAAFTYVIGAVELGGAMLLLIPRVASYSAAVLIVVMLGAVATLTTTSYETQMGLTQPAIHLIVLAVLFRARWARRWRP